MTAWSGLEPKQKRKNVETQKNRMLLSIQNKACVRVLCVEACIYVHAYMYIDAFSVTCVCVTTRQRKPNVWECLGFGGLGELEVFGLRGFRGARSWSVWVSGVWGERSWSVWVSGVWVRVKRTGLG